VTVQAWAIAGGVIVLGIHIAVFVVVRRVIDRPDDIDSKR
jgi:hypothetical protein